MAGAVCVAVSPVFGVGYLRVVLPRLVLSSSLFACVLPCLLWVGKCGGGWGVLSVIALCLCVPPCTVVCGVCVLLLCCVVLLCVEEGRMVCVMNGWVCGL